jgi:hypothetical protein
VIAGPTLADVVQQRTDGQQVRTIDSPKDLRGLDARLDAVPIDGVAVHWRRRSAQADVGPLRQPVIDHSGVVELVPHWHQARAGGEQVDQGPGGAGRPRHRELAERGREVRGGARPEGQTGAGRDGCRT